MKHEEAVRIMTHEEYRCFVDESGVKTIRLERPASPEMRRQLARDTALLIMAKRLAS